MCNDLFRAVLNILGVSTSNVSAIGESMQEIAEELKSSGGYGVLNPHSNGGQTVYLASKNLKEVKGHFMVESIASTHFFADDEGFLGVPINHTGRSDLVMELSTPHGLMLHAIRRNGELQFHGNPFQIPCYSHSFRSNEYTEVVKKIVSRHS